MIKKQLNDLIKITVSKLFSLKRQHYHRRASKIIKKYALSKWFLFITIILIQLNKYQTTQVALYSTSLFLNIIDLNGRNIFKFVVYLSCLPSLLNWDW